MPWSYRRGPPHKAALTKGPTVRPKPNPIVPIEAFDILTLDEGEIADRISVAAGVASLAVQEFYTEMQERPMRLRFEIEVARQYTEDLPM